jgi:hypothetical protein
MAVVVVAASTRPGHGLWAYGGSRQQQQRPLMAAPPLSLHLPQAT